MFDNKILKKSNNVSLRYVKYNLNLKKIKYGKTNASHKIVNITRYTYYILRVRLYINIFLFKW